MKIQFKKSFWKQYEKLSKRDQEKTFKALELFERNPTDPLLRNHVLKGESQGLRSIKAGNDLLIMLSVEGNYVIVTCLQVGSHNQLY